MSSRKTRYRHRQKPIRDVVSSVILPHTPNFAKARYRRKEAFRKGLKYENQVHEYMFDKFGVYYAPGVWFRYTTEDAPKRENYIQTDGLVIDVEKGLVTIVEVKWAHNVGAYVQLVERYLPVVSHFFGSDLFEFRTVEVVHWYDANIKFPGVSKLAKDVANIEKNCVGIHIWRPDYGRRNTGS